MTLPAHINASGSIVGGYAMQANDGNHGFVRSSTGAITTFDEPDAAQLPGYGTFPTGLNGFGTIVGVFYDVNNVQHGFVRTPSGAFFTLDAPGVEKNPGYGTQAWAINDAGAIVGPCVGPPDRGFLRTKAGAFYEFGRSSFYTDPYAINSNETIAGTITNSTGEAAQGNAPERCYTHVV